MTQIPLVDENVPRRGSSVGRFLGRLVMSLGKWTFSGTTPSLSRAVIIVAPHSSNWDFVWGAAGMLALDLDLRFIGKHTLFKGPLGILMKGLGGLPVDRGKPGSGIVEEAISLFQSAEKMLLALSPEGTRTKVARWRTGFHHIAAGAHVPIVPIALDYGPREIRFGMPLETSDDLEGDLLILKQFFVGTRGRKNQNNSSIRNEE